ncbi:hypothetical protein MtrunA17_Chr5g0441361 [Medicago truncatula]|uniref:Transmembrane protein, putative n=1 Tax=Medicago truncatula TaxID=3880 RepID=A0A072UR94_MEDTR|nr:transmembrane protein, putative [Medicago truncatula]RHN57528.1 hypothetical protein MtrunA17_Chr5g0441361 [Medicago truncatula]
MANSSSPITTTTITTTTVNFIMISINMKSLFVAISHVIFDIYSYSSLTCGPAIEKNIILFRICAYLSFLSSLFTSLFSPIPASALIRRGMLVFSDITFVCGLVFLMVASHRSFPAVSLFSLFALIKFLASRFYSVFIAK